MKKLMLMPLMAGVVWVCSASPIPNVSQEGIASEISHNFNPDLLKQIFEVASPLFESEYGIKVTPAALQAGYDNGTVTVEDIGGNQYRVSYGGNIVISTMEDFL